MTRRSHARAPGSWIRHTLCSSALVLLLQPHAAWTQTDAAAPPRDALLGAAQAQRDRGQWNDAAELYRQGQRRFPQDDAFVFGEIYALADSATPAAAVALAEPLLTRRPRDPDVLLVTAYAMLRTQGAFAALEYVDRAYQIAPTVPYVAREYILSLQRTGMHSQALELAQRQPQLLSAGERRVLEADAVAEVVKLASTPTTTEAERFVLADRALARYAELQQQWEPLSEPARPVLTRIRIDRLEALHARSAMAELVASYEQLVQEGVAVPDYILGDVASAYLATRQPERARELYAHLIQAGYMRGDDSVRFEQDNGLLYAYSDMGDTATAAEKAAPLPLEYARWRFLPGDTARLPNAAYEDAEQTSILMQYYANDTPGAQARLEEILRRAPGNTAARTALAAIYRARGWPRAAEEQMKLAELNNPRALGTEVEQGFNALDLREWRQAEILSQDLDQRYPESTQTQRLHRLWEVHNKMEWQVRGYKGISSNSPISGSGSFGIETVLYSSPLDYHWRLFGGAGHLSGRFPEGKGNYNFGRMGLEWRSRDWQAEAEVSGNDFGYGQRTGARISATHDLNDAWQWSLAGNWRARDTPLRALNSNITSNSVEASVRWRESERREWSLGITPARFSDGNRRYSALLMGRERLLTRPSWSLDLGLEAALQTNSNSNVPYFSPRREASLTPLLHWNHTLYSRYQTAWTQNASIGVGGLHQRDYGGSVLGVVSYGQRYRANDVLDLGATLSGISRSYDGTREHEWRLVLDMTYRF